MNSDDADSAIRRLDAGVLVRWPMHRAPDSDTFDHGTVLVVGGASETPGAVVLAGMAALRMGAGRLQIATAASVATAVAVAVPEALVLPVLDGRQDLTSRIAVADAIVVGPGVAVGERLHEVLDAVVDDASPAAVAVVDAAALAALADLEPERLRRWRGRLVITPNRGEAETLLERFGPRAADRSAGADRDDLARLAACTGAVVTSFGHVRAPDGRAWHAIGHASLGTSGSGDVLAGLVAGAAARTGDAAQAACWATFAHARAGRLLGHRFGAGGFLARELLDAVGTILGSQTVR